MGLKTYLIAAFAATFGIVGGAAHATTALMDNGLPQYVTASYMGYGAALNPGETLITNFSSPTSLPTGYALSGDAAFLTGTSNAGAAPAMSATTVDTGKYLSVEAGKSETLTTLPITEASIYVGSLDSWNTLSFTFDNGITESFTGTQLGAVIPATAAGDRQSAGNNGRFTFDFSVPVTDITFASSTNSFEIANVATTQPGGVPEPDAWALMLIGVGALGMTMRSRRRADQALDAKDAAALAA
jgi:hypothetical protein